MTSTGKIVTSLAIGVAIGTTLGLLFAPHKGKKTRAMIADKSKEAADAIESTYKKAREMVGLKNGTEKFESVS